MKSLGVFTAKNAEGIDPIARRSLRRMGDVHQDTVNGCAYSYETGGKPSPRENVVWDDGTTWRRTSGGRFGTPKNEPADNAEGGSGLWFAVVQCQKCGLCFTNPRPTVATIRRFYPPTYRPHQTVHSARSGRRPGAYQPRAHPPA